MRKPSTAKISSPEYNILEVINRKNFFRKNFFRKTFLPLRYILILYSFIRRHFFLVTSESGFIVHVFSKYKYDLRLIFNPLFTGLEISQNKICGGECDSCIF